MQIHGWVPRSVSQEQAVSATGTGAQRTNSLSQTARRALILALTLGSIGAVDAAVMSGHGNGEHARFHHSAGSTQIGRAAYLAGPDHLGTPWMY
jgi:hypothetical protein